MGKSEGIRIFLRIRPAAKGLPKPLNNNNNNNINMNNNNNTTITNYNVDHTFDSSTVHFHLDRRLENEIINNTLEDYKFTFRRAFEPAATQEEVFNIVAKDCVLSALDGYNSTIFAYGQTGSGKTYSITGGAESYNDRGIIPRALTLIYDEIHKRQQECVWSVAVSYLQIYNDKGQDLLNRGQDAKKLEELPPVTIHESDGEEVILKGLAQHTAPNAQEALGLLFLGDTNRLYCETPMNKTSSRSHCVFTVYIEARAHGSSVVRKSKLNLVDLAGSERVSKTGITGNILTEAKHINLSLHYLEQVIMALSEQASGRREHIPFRNSFMTMVLRDSLGVNCKTSMLATAHPALEQLSETISTCRFAQRVALIRQEAKINEEVDPHVLVRKLKAELQLMRDQLAFYNNNNNNENNAPDRELTEDEKQRCEEMVRRFVADTNNESRIEGFDGDLARIYYCFDILKRMLSDSGSNINNIINNNNSNNGRGNQQQELLEQQLEAYRTRIDALEMSLQQKENEMNTLFNVLQQTQRARFNAETQTGRITDNESESNGSICMRTAVPMTAIPGSFSQTNNNNNNNEYNPNVSTSTPNSIQGENPIIPTKPSSQLRKSVCEKLPPAQATAVDEFFRKQEQLNEIYNLSALTDADLLQDRAIAFEAFSRSYRQWAQVEANKRELKEKYENCKNTARLLNEAVDKIKNLKSHIQKLRAERAMQGVEEIDECESRALEELTQQKASYNNLANSLRQQKEEIDAMHIFMKRAQEQLTKDFEDWLQIRQKQLALATGANNNNNNNSNNKQNVMNNGIVASPLLQRNNILNELSQQRIGVNKAMTPPELPPLREETIASARTWSGVHGLGGGNNNNNTNNNSNNNNSGSLSSGSMGITRGLANTSTSASNVSNSITTLVNNNNNNNNIINNRNSNNFIESLPPHPATAPAELANIQTRLSTPTRGRMSSVTLAPLQQRTSLINGWTNSTNNNSNNNNNNIINNSALVFNERENAPNPYAPEHRSTGDAVADKQLAALYKARDAMRLQFQS